MDIKTVQPGQVVYFDCRQEWAQVIKIDGSRVQIQSVYKVNTHRLFARPRPKWVYPDRLSSLTLGDVTAHENYLANLVVQAATARQIMISKGLK